MPISQISPNSLATNSPYVNPSAKTTETQAGAIQQGNQDAQKPAKAAQTDTVTISQQALQMTGNSTPQTNQAKAGATGQQQMTQQMTQQQKGSSFSVQG